MFSKRMVVIVGVFFLIVANIVILFISSSRVPSYGIGRAALFLVAPVQDLVSTSIQTARNVWQSYFMLVATAEENARLEGELQRANARNSQWHEMELSNTRLRRLLDFKVSLEIPSVAAEVIGMDPSPWYRAVIINKGSRDGVRKGLPLGIPEGIAGQVIDVSPAYAKVMLITDRNSAVDALVERTRARGIIKGDSTDSCVFEYALRKDEVKIGDKIVASGLDGVFPKGMPIGEVSGVVRRSAGIFQEVSVTPYVDFEKIEEMLVLLTPPMDQPAGPQ
ncbi:MAG: rod shape-determining protein MreC [Desulfobacterales bacterium]